MWKYGFKIYECKDTIGPAHVELSVVLDYPGYQLFRSLNYVGVMSIYKLTLPVKRELIYKGLCISGSVHNFDDIIVKPGEELFVAFQGVKKKEHAMLAQSIAARIHYYDKNMTMKEDRHLLSRQHNTHPFDVFNCQLQ